MNYKFWYAWYRLGLYLQQPYIRGKWWRLQIYRIQNYFCFVLPLDIQIARQLTYRFVRAF